MRLLQLKLNGEFSLTKNLIDDIPPYAVLSHTWGDEDEEPTFKDLTEGSGRNKAGYRKIKFCADQAARDGLQHFWVDTCCIDKTNSAELQEAINSMFRWYRNAVRCYVYLSDVSKHDQNQYGISFLLWEAEFRKSRWFTRGWTLQELIAPMKVEFFSSEGEPLGDKKSLRRQVHEITGVPFEALEGNALFEISVAERMSWAESRRTKREEDMAYSLLGIFNVHLPLIYGEGKENALRRLRKEVDSQLLPIQMPVQEASQLTPSLVIPFRRDRDFVERSILGEILQRASEPGTRIGLVGLGGVGKSQLAIEYAYRVRETHPETWVFWVHASSASRFEESYESIAARLQLPGWNEPKTDILGIVHEWLSNENNGRWTLLLDNADDPGIMFRPRNGEKSITTPAASLARSLSEYLPLSSHSSIVITSRSRDVVRSLQVFEDDILEVGPMEVDVARNLLLKKLRKAGREADTDELVRLAKHLDYMPLAITQAAAYIEQASPRVTVPKYIEILERNDSECAALLQRDVRDPRRDRQASNSIIMTWHVTFTHLRQTKDSAARLLSLMSLFDREAIPDHLLEGQYADTSVSEIDLEDDIVTLRAYSLISVGTSEHLFDMHRLVQLSTQKWLEIHAELLGWQERYIDVLDAVFPDDDYANWTTCQVLFPHVEVMEMYHVTSAEHLQIWAKVLRNFAWYATRRGQYGLADKMARASLKAREELFGIDSAVALDSMNILAIALWYQCKYEQAEEMQQRVLAGREKALGVDHPDTLTSLNNLAEALKYQGKYAEAEEMHQRVFAGKEKVLGVDHPDTLTSLSNLAEALKYQGKYEQAEEMHGRALAKRDKALGVDHPDTLMSMSNLAETLKYQGKYAEAEEIHQRVLAERDKALGMDHPDTLTSLSNLAEALKYQGKYEQAEEMHRRALAKRNKTQGVDHPDTLTSMYCLADLLDATQNHREALNFYERAITGYRMVLGQDHPTTLACQKHMESLVQKIDRRTE